MHNYLKLTVCFLTLFCVIACKTKQEEPNSKTVLNKEADKPKIVNIINFIRDIEPRDEAITKEVLFETTKSQVEIMREYDLGGTFLLQYDALMDERYQELLKGLPVDSFEIGAWWEIPQPLVEKAGLEWRGRFPWDWHPDVGFSTGYTPKEREQLVDVYMEDFKKIFGYYPKSVASWFIDAHTLNYMYEKYDIIASANCKDQYGTDGYTLWGGYWNQAYYPSKLNSYMPAQNAENQIPVPVFRMLGSDPIYQYDTGLEHDRQGVISMEPVYPRSGGSEQWVDWYMKNFVEGEPMQYAYVQVGQENSFIWKDVKQGFEYQMPLFAKLRDQGKIKVETLAETGAWFKENFKVTPATSVTVNTDYENGNKKTVWFNSKNYRVNLLWEDNTLRFRDIHLFDESIQSSYLEDKLESNQALFFTQPFVDGYLWSTAQKLAGLRFKQEKNSKIISLKGEDPIITNPKEGRLEIVWPLQDDNGTIKMEIDEDKTQITHEGGKSLDWFLELTVAKTDDLPFQSIEDHKIESLYQGKTYTVSALKGKFSKPVADEVFRIYPEDNIIKLNFKQ